MDPKKSKKAKSPTAPRPILSTAAPTVATSPEPETPEAPSPAKRGRPSKFDDLRKNIILDSIYECPIKQLAAQEGKINITTLDRWLKEDEQFRIEFEYLKGKAQKRLWGESQDHWKKLKASDHKTFKDTYEDEIIQVRTLSVDSGAEEEDDFPGY